jgi:hypothetical protein
MFMKVNHQAALNCDSKKPKRRMRMNKFMLFKGSTILAVSVGHLAIMEVMASSPTWEFNPTNGHYYALTEELSWEDAESQAVSWGGHLVTINDQAENDWLVSQYNDPGSDNQWIGLSRTTTPDWEWVSGEPVSFTNWRPSTGEPNNQGGQEFYAELLGGQPDGDSLGYWNDIGYTSAGFDGLKPGIVERVVQCDAPSLLNETSTIPDVSQAIGQIAMYGNTVIGSNYESTDPTVFIFERDGDDWALVQELKYPGGEASTRFGEQFDLDGDILVVTAGIADLAGNDSGAACLYRRNSCGWEFEAFLTPSILKAGDHLRYASLSGDTVLVGMSDADVYGTDSGAIMIFEYDRVIGEWVEQGLLPIGSASAFEYLGESEIDGDRAIACVNQDSDMAPDAGAAYVFDRQLDGTWIQTAKLYAPDPGAGDWFAQQAALEGNRLVLGGTRDDSPTANDTGSMYVFEYDPNAAQWIFQQKLQPDELQGGDLFGVPALQGDLIVSGSPYHNNNEGAAWVYAYDGMQWCNIAKLTASDATAGDYFGRCREISGDEFICPAGGSVVGNSYVFRGFGDCDNSGVLDVFEIGDGQLQDVNLNGVPDNCENGPQVDIRIPQGPVDHFTGYKAICQATMIFDDDVLADPNDLEVRDIDGTIVTVTGDSNGTNKLTITFDPPLYANTYHIRLLDTCVSTTTARALDGDADGVAGGDYEFTLTHTLIGDINQDGFANSFDIDPFVRVLLK